jgi:thiamine-phosphate pyrophosphorylase
MPTETPPGGGRIALITPLIGEGVDLHAALSAALEAAPVASVILRLPETADQRGLLKRLKPLVAVAQEHGAAALLDGMPDLVGRSGSDGLHVAAEHVAEAIERFQPEKIVGAGALRLRDDAMEAGEAGADYLLFGEPDPVGELPPFAAVVDRVRWWVEVFEPPCMGYAPDLDGIVPLAAAGADFVALGAAVWEHREGPAAALRQALMLLRSAEPAT